MDCVDNRINRIYFRQSTPDTRSHHRPYAIRTHPTSTMSASTCTCLEPTTQHPSLSKVLACLLSLSQPQRLRMPSASEICLKVKSLELRLLWVLDSDQISWAVFCSFDNQSQFRWKLILCFFTPLFAFILKKKTTNFCKLT